MRTLLALAFLIASPAWSMPINTPHTIEVEKSGITFRYDFDAPLPVNHGGTPTLSVHFNLSINGTPTQAQNHVFWAVDSSLIDATWSGGFDGVQWEYSCNQGSCWLHNYLLNVPGEEVSFRMNRSSMRFTAAEPSAIIEGNEITWTLNPEPGTAILLGLGLIAISRLRRHA